MKAMMPLQKATRAALFATALLFVTLFAIRSEAHNVDLAPIAVREWHDQIVFLRKIVEGPEVQTMLRNIAAAADRMAVAAGKLQPVITALEATREEPALDRRQWHVAWRDLGRRWARGLRQSRQFADRRMFEQVALPCASSSVTGARAVRAA